VKILNARHSREYTEFNIRYSPPLNVEERIQKRRKEEEENIASSNMTLRAIFSYPQQKD
jgi:hypothetical protein